jgi:hypothetical protein
MPRSVTGVHMQEVPLSYPAPVEQREWLVQVVLRASEEEAEQVVDRLGDAICVPADHDGPCVTPWTIIRTALDDKPEAEQASWRALLDQG